MLEVVSVELNRVCLIRSEPRKAPQATRSDCRWWQFSDLHGPSLGRWCAFVLAYLHRLNPELVQIKDRINGSELPINPGDTTSRIFCRAPARLEQWSDFFSARTRTLAFSEARNVAVQIFFSVGMS